MVAAIELVCAVSVAAILLRWILRRILLMWLGVKSTDGLPQDPLDRLLLRFQKVRTSAWLFARFKVRLDPMFRELPELLKGMPPPLSILDIGCGYGITGSALLEWFPGAMLAGIDPSKRRVRVASKIFAERGRAFQARAPDLPMAQIPDRVDAAFILDVIHYLADDELQMTLQKVRERMRTGRWLVVRASIPEAPTKSLFFRLEGLQRLLTRGRLCYRTSDRVEQMLQSAGFAVLKKQMSGTRGELCWFIAARI